MYDGYLAGLAERNQLQGLHFSDGTPQPGIGARYLLIAQAGEAVGYLNWIPFPSRCADAAHHRAIYRAGGTGDIPALPLYGAATLELLGEPSRNPCSGSARREAQAQHLAFHDVLTGLPNPAHWSKTA
ncbi:Uncharacterised protein [Pantoea agglomerans]|uniref:Uncharacterized protein n=1 Tax=Enterobacter agglomerans TaxID=549 RepID=A0A379AE97_ENTAG|nr:Uncharacterised protein [Pantoea agglomerans]